jgi:hypothetical protein
MKSTWQHMLEIQKERREAAALLKKKLEKPKGKYETPTANGRVIAFRRRVR